jgi:hypothetical protein
MPGFWWTIILEPLTFSLRHGIMAECVFANEAGKIKQLSMFVILRLVKSKRTFL